jgi:formate hydrogenlyase subunit 3/multisubunit Na+/H+ antiporter MnhD subunit
MPLPSALHSIFTLVMAWIVLGAAGLLFPRNLTWVSRVLFPLGAAVAAAIAVCAYAAFALPAETATLPIGLPDLPMHLRLDALSAFFLLLIGIAVAGVSIYSAGYFRAGEGAAPGLM